jgi:hypothetical protein
MGLNMAFATVLPFDMPMLPLDLVAPIATTQLGGMGDAAVILGGGKLDVAPAAGKGPTETSIPLERQRSPENALALFGEAIEQLEEEGEGVRRTIQRQHNSQTKMVPKGSTPATGNSSLLPIINEGGQSNPTQSSFQGKCRS